MQMNKIVSLDSGNQEELIPVITLFLLMVMSVVVIYTEVIIPGGAACLYAGIEAGVKNG